MSASVDPGGGPDPEQAADLAGFIDLLNQLRLWAGAPSVRSLAKQVGPLMRPPRTISHSTVAEVFQTWRRRLDLDLVIAIVRALGADEPTVRRWRAAYLRVHRDSKTGGTTAVLRQLPVDLATFTGREKELATLIEGADQDSHTVVISAVEGMAGIGKTQLALHAAHRLVQSGRYADVQLYANLRGFDPDHAPSDPAVILDAFLRQLEVSAAQVPAGLDERAAMFRDRIHGRQALLLLDNAADDDQLRPLLPASSTCLVLITSRRSLVALEGARTVTLDVLDPTEAVELLARIVGSERVGAEPEAAERLAQLCGGLPLAVSLVAARLRSRPVWTLGFLADRLGTGLTEIAVGTRGLARVFDLSYQGLPPSAQRVFRLLGLHPALDFTAASITALTGLDLDEAEQVLESLQDESLIQQKVLGRYELHDLLRAYAAERAAAEMSDEERSEAVAAVFHWYVAATLEAGRVVNLSQPLPFPAAEARGHSMRYRDSRQALAWYDRERPNLLRIFSGTAELEYDREVVLLALGIARVEDVVRNWCESERLLRAALPHARRCAVPGAEAQVLQRIGFILWSDNRSEEAIGPLEEALALTREHYDLVTGQQVLNGLAMAYTGVGDHERGLEVALQALALRDHDEVRLARRSFNVFNTVAICYHNLGRPVEALTHVIASIDAARAEDDQIYVTLGLHNLGFTHLMLERYADAITAFEQSVAMAGDLGHLYIHADSLNGIARVWHAQGRLPEAQEWHRKALAVFDGLPPAEVVRYRHELDVSPLRYPL